MIRYCNSEIIFVSDIFITSQKLLLIEEAVLIEYNVKY